MKRPRAAIGGLITALGRDDTPQSLVALAAIFAGLHFGHTGALAVGGILIADVWLGQVLKVVYATRTRSGGGG